MQSLQTTIVKRALRQHAADSDTRGRLLQECFGVDWEESERQPLEQFFDYFDMICTAFDVATRVLQSDQTLEGGTTAIRDELPKIARELLTGTRTEIVSRGVSDRALIFTVRRLLCIDPERWSRDETLAEFISRDFAFTDTSFSADKAIARLPTSFNAMTLQKVTSINIVWTTHLSSHLEVSGDDSKIAIFANAKFIQLLATSRFACLFPKDFLSLTLDTYALMLPADNKKLETWFQGVLKVDAKVSPTCLTGRSLRSSKSHVAAFKFYQDRLMIAKDVFDSKQPRNLWQLWKDTRNTTQWWTFWIGSLIFALAIVSCVLSAMQVYKAYHPTPI